MPKGGCSKTPQQEDFSLSNDMVEKQTGKKVTLGLAHSFSPYFHRLHLILGGISYLDTSYTPVLMQATALASSSLLWWCL